MSISIPSLTNWHVQRLFELHKNGAKVYVIFTANSVVNSFLNTWDAAGIGAGGASGEGPTLAFTGTGIVIQEKK